MPDLTYLATFSMLATLRMNLSVSSQATSSSNSVLGSRKNSKNLEPGLWISIIFLRIQIQLFFSMRIRIPLFF